MRQLFDDLAAGGAEAVRSLAGRHETLELDFKSRTPNGKGGLREDKRVLGKALSAFANSMGGTIVWGVNCRPGKDGVDCVRDFVPITQLARFASEMRNLVVEALVPRHPEILVEPIFDIGDTGFLIIHVPRSERRPHMSLFNDKGYFRRTVGSSRQMEHYEIEDAFKRESLPNLEVEHSIVQGGGFVDGMQASLYVKIQIALRNTSRMSARMPYIAVPKNYGFHTVDLPPGTQARGYNSKVYAEDTNAVVHPGQARVIAPIRVNLQFRRRNDDLYIRRENAELAIEVDYGCLDCTSKTALLYVAPERVVSAIQEGNVLFE